MDSGLWHEVAKARSLGLEDADLPYMELS